MLSCINTTGTLTHMPPGLFTHAKPTVCSPLAPPLRLRFIIFIHFLFSQRSALLDLLCFRVTSYNSQLVLMVDEMHFHALGTRRTPLFAAPVSENIKIPSSTLMSFSPPQQTRLFFRVQDDLSMSQTPPLAMPAAPDAATRSST